MIVGSGVTPQSNDRRAQASFSRSYSSRAAAPFLCTWVFVSHLLAELMNFYPRDAGRIRRILFCDVGHVRGRLDPSCSPRYADLDEFGKFPIALRISRRSCTGVLGSAETRIAPGLAEGLVEPLRLGSAPRPLKSCSLSSSAIGGGRRRWVFPTHADGKATSTRPLAPVAVRRRTACTRSFMWYLAFQVFGELLGEFAKVVLAGS